MLGAYPNGFRRTTSEWLAGAPCDDGCGAATAQEAIEPAAFAATVAAWAAPLRGARILGGCCATGPAHIAALAAALGRRDAAVNQS